MKNTRKPAVLIMLRDIQMSMSADPVSHMICCHVISSRCCCRLYRLCLNDPFSPPLLILHPELTLETLRYILCVCVYGHNVIIIRG